MISYKEIVTKAVIGKAKKNTTNNFQIECEQKPDTVLGCWVINHKFLGGINNGVVNINGSYDVNVWYSYDNDSKTSVTTRNFTYSDIMNIPLKESSKIDRNSEIIVNCLNQPTVSDAKINNGLVSLKIDKLMGVEVIGNTTVKVQVEESEDDYEEIFDTLEEEELNVNIDNLSDDFLNDVNK